jgi:hypothetical protein
MSDDVGVVKATEGVVEYYCGESECLTPLNSSFRKCYACGSKKIEKFTREDYGPVAQVTEIFAGNSEHKLR